MDRLKDSKINEEKFDRFVDGFNDKIYPTIVGEDGEGLRLFQEHIEKKRDRVKWINEKKRSLSSETDRLINL